MKQTMKKILAAVGDLRQLPLISNRAADNTTTTTDPVTGTTTTQQTTTSSVGNIVTYTPDSITYIRTAANAAPVRYYYTKTRPS